MVRWAAVILLGLFILFGSYSFENVGEAFKYYGEKISESHPGIGVIVLIVLLFLLVFSDNFIGFLKKSRKYKLKQKF